jgi:hypothetical protein
MKDEPIGACKVFLVEDCMAPPLASLGHEDLLEQMGSTALTPVAGVGLSKLMVACTDFAHLCFSSVNLALVVILVKNCFQSCPMSSGHV